MTDNIQTIDRDYGYVSTAQERNKVLRNTYWLLALSLIPTVLGAWLGVATGITQSLGGGLGMIVFLVACSDLCTPSKKPRTLHGPDALAHDRHGAGLQKRA